MKKLFYQFIATWMMAAMVVVPTEVRAQSAQTGMKPPPLGVQLNAKPRLADANFLKSIGIEKAKFHSLESNSSFNDFLLGGQFSKDEVACIQKGLDKNQLTQFAGEKYASAVAISAYVPREFKFDCGDGKTVVMEILGVEQQMTPQSVAANGLALPRALQNYGGIQEAQAAGTLAAIGLFLVAVVVTIVVVLSRGGGSGNDDDEPPVGRDENCVDAGRDNDCDTPE